MSAIFLTRTRFFSGFAISQKRSYDKYFDVFVGTVLFTGESEEARELYLERRNSEGD